MERSMPTTTVALHGEREKGNTKSLRERGEIQTSWKGEESNEWAHYLLDIHISKTTIQTNIIAKYEHFS
jgi:muconolactone delta-isomerase